MKDKIPLWINASITNVSIGHDRILTPSKPIESQLQPGVGGDWDIAEDTQDEA